jgi:hypothetical protein
MPFDIENFSDRLDTECSLYVALITAKSRLALVAFRNARSPDADVVPALYDSGEAGNIPRVKSRESASYARAWSHP